MDVNAADRPILVGAVAYHPRIVTIWEAFSAYFADRGLPIDYILYSNYGRLNAAVRNGQVDIGWCTNTAYVALEQEVSGELQLLGMRDLDADWSSVILTRWGDGFSEVSELAGKRLALGSGDSGHAAILPLHYLAKEGLDAATECELVRFDTDVGKHGDTGDSEVRVVAAVAEGRADAGAIGEPTLEAMRAQGLEALDALEVAWRSPTYYHCTFAALPTFDAGRAACFQEALLAMGDDARFEEAMRLEGVKERWMIHGREGYKTLTAAMREQQHLV